MQGISQVEPLRKYFHIGRRAAKTAQRELVLLKINGTKYINMEKN